MKHLKSFKFLGTTFMLAIVGCTQPEQTEIDKILDILHHPDSRKVMVVCHRGDWRNYPENSIPAIESVIKMGADMVEIDIRRTADGELVLCHDRTIDRMTTGHGEVASMTLDSIRTFKMKRMHGIKTDTLKIPTLEEVLLLCKDRILVNIDKGYDYYDQVLALTEKIGVTDQVLIKGKKSIAHVEADMAKHENNLLYMPVIDVHKQSGKNLYQEYVNSGTVPLAFELCWNQTLDDVQEIVDYARKTGSKLWVNTLWPSLCGGFGNDDDAAYMNNDPSVYQKYIDMGFSIIQTDHPQFLLDYLRKKNLHD